MANAEPNQSLGLVVGVLVACADGLHLCLDTEDAVREGDFVRVKKDRLLFAESLGYCGDFKGVRASTEKVFAVKAEVDRQLLALRRQRQKA